MTNPLIELTEVTYDVALPRPKRILGPLSLTVDTGEKVAIVGPSGAGKSTLVSILGAMTPLGTGRYRFGDHDLTRSTSRALARFRAQYIGFLFQHAHLLDARTVGDNVALGLSATRHPGQTVAAVLDAVGINHLADRPARYLSGGERHRVALARALVKEPVLLIADEPTGSLDQRTGRHILDLLTSVTSTGTTLLIVTHDQAAAERTDRTLRIVDGTLR